MPIKPGGAPKADKVEDGGEAKQESEAPRPPAKHPSCEAVGDGDDGNCQLMPFDDGSMTADKAQSSAMTLVINYAEPIFAAGAAVFGLGLLVLPFLARLNEIRPDSDSNDNDKVFSYVAHGETNTKQPMRLFTESEMKQRLGLLDAAFLRKEITMSTSELDAYMNKCEMDQTDDEVSKMQKWRDKVNANMKSLQKRSALAFLGLPPEASDTDIGKMYKKMALELHPDKGGDPEKFQELQEMKERLNEIEDDKDGKQKTEEEEADEEAKKEKEKEAKEEEDEAAKLPPDERIKKLRMDIHDNTTRVWEKAKKAKDEIVGDKAIKSNSQPALNILRLFVDRFVTNEIKTLRHDDTKGAETKFRKFIKQGAEIIAVAALHDVQTTLSTIAMNFNYRLVARSGSPDIKNKCAALLEAISEVPTQAEAFIKSVEDMIADQQDREKRHKEEQGRKQKEREAKGDLRGDAADEGGAAKTNSKQDPSAAKAPPPKAGAAPPKAGVAGAGYPKAADPFADFDFSDKSKKPPEPKAAPKAAGPCCEALKVKKDDEKSEIAAAMNKPKRTGWDPNFDHPYAGALKSNGTGVYCRPCQRWIMTYEYSTEVFLTHVERVHPKPPPGF